MHICVTSNFSFLNTFHSTDLEDSDDDISEIQQEILLLILDQDLTLSEIATILQIPLGTIKSHVHRAKISLLKILRPQEENDDGLGKRI